MTAPAGAIKVDLTIDGSGVGTEVSQALNKQLRPIIAEATRNIEGLDSTLKKVGSQSGFTNVIREAGKATDALDKVTRSAAETGRGVEKYAENARAAYKKVTDATKELQHQQEALERQQKSGDSAWIAVQAERVKQAKKAEAQAVKEAAEAYGAYERAARGTQSLNLSDRFRAAAGEATGAGQDAAENFLQGFTGASALWRLGGAGGPVGLAFAGIAAAGLVVGKELADNIEIGLQSLHIKDVFATRLGIDQETAAKYGRDAAAAYTQAWGDSVEDNLGAIQFARQGGLLDADATEAEVQSVIAKLQTLQEVMGKDVPEAARAAGQLIRGGLVADADEAFDVLVSGFQRGNDISGDWLDTITEYTTQFRKLGIDGDEAIGLIQQGLQGAARDSDVVADSIKEFSVRAVDGSKTTAEGFQALGFDAEDMSRRFAEGGKTAHDAFDEVFRALRELDDPMQQKLAWQSLFGTQWEDLGDAVQNFDLRAADALGSVQGASDEATAAVGRHVSEWDKLGRNVDQVFTKVREWLADSEIAKFFNVIPETLNGILNPDSQQFGPAGPISGATPGIPVNPGSLPSILGGGQPITSNTPGSLTDLLVPSTIPAPDQAPIPIPDIPDQATPVPIVPDSDKDKKSDKQPSDKERREQIAADLDPSLWQVNLDNIPGAPGQLPMQVTVTNLPASSGSFGAGAAPLLSGGALSQSVLGTPVYTGPATEDTGGAVVPRIAQLEQVVQRWFPNVTIGNDYRHPDGFNEHSAGEAVDFMIPGYDTPAGKALGDQLNQFLLANAESLGLQYNIWQQKNWNPDGSTSPNVIPGGGPTVNHMDHIHSRVLPGPIDGVPPALSNIAVPQLIGGSGLGAFQVDRQAIIRAEQDVIKRGEALEAARRERVILEHDNLATEDELREARQKERNAEWDLQNAKADLAEKERGTFRSSSQQKSSLSFRDFPYGDPRRALAGVLGGIGVSGEDIGALLGAAAGPLGQVAGDVAATVGGFPLPGPLGYGGTPTAPSTTVGRLADENNPLFWAQAAGFDVPDFARTGGGPSAQDLTVNAGLPNDAAGRIYSDTAALIDRTFTNLDTAEKARHDQVMAVLNEVRDRLSAELLGPVVQDSVTGGINGMGAGTSEAIGASMGNAAGPIIASAVASASSGSGGNPGGALVNTAAQAAAAAGSAATSVNSGGFHSFDFDSGGGLFAPLPFGHGPLGNLYDQGGLWPTGTFGTNLSGHPERVLDPEQTRLFDAGLLGGWNLQPLQQQFAAGAAGVMGGVDVSATVGAEWMGVSQLPIISAIANLLVAVLLKVIGVQIQARDTLDEISSEFRDFRGDFQAFDAAGRVLNDTSGLVDRTGTSEQAAVDERVRILKQVLEGLLQFLIEKIIVPISKAVANTAINIGSQMAAGAIGGAGNIVPGGGVVSGMVGSMVGSAISSAGTASVDIIAEVGTILAESLISVGLDAIGSLFQSYLPDLSTLFFGGGVPAMVFDPIGQLLTGALGGVTSALTGLFGGLASLIPGLPFDDGGVAVGAGLLPKAVLAPERVLSPRQTVAFERLPDALHELVGALQRSASTPASKTVHAPITVTGGPQAAHQIADRLTSLL